MKSPFTLTNPIAAFGVAALCCAFVPPAGAQQPDAANGLSVPGTKPVASYEASGVQIYACTRGADGTLQWKFKAPEANLYDDAGALAAHHFAGPSWHANDGSEIKGKVVRQAPSDTPGSVPQLLLAATSVGAKGTFSDVAYVQRLATVGGIAPSRPCTSVGEEGRSPYLARYVFLR